MMETVELLNELIGIPSVSRKETDIAGYIASLIEGEVRSFPRCGAPDGENVIAISEPFPDKPFILLNGHHDTVAPADGWISDPFTPSEGDDSIYGLGVHDMKAGLSVIIKLFLEFRNRLNLIFTSVGDEESDSMGSFALVDTDHGSLSKYLPRISGALLTEPTHERVMLGARGRYALLLSVRGKAAHGARPSTGINAVDKAAEVIQALTDLPMDSHPVLGNGSYCILGIRGGTETLSVPDHCEILVDRHLTSHRTEREVIQEFRNIIQPLDVDVDISLVEREVPFLKPYVRSRDEPFIREFLQALGGREEQDIIYGESVGDYNIFGNLLPTIVYGPKGGNHHSANEHVSRSSLENVHGQLRQWLDILSKDY